MISEPPDPGQGRAQEKLPGSLAAILLAGRRRGGDPLASALGLSDKWMVEIGGKQMLSRVLEALRGTGRFESILVVSDAREAVLESVVAQELNALGTLHILAPARSPASSVLEALATLPKYTEVLLTTADHALLNGSQIEAFLDGASKDADFVAALADVEALERRFPEVKRTAWRFKGQKVAGCNLFLLRKPQAQNLLVLWRSVEADRKRPLRILRRFGLGLLITYLLGQLSLQRALERLGSLAGCKVAAFSHPDPLVGIDVDTLEDLKLVESILAQDQADTIA